MIRFIGKALLFGVPFILSASCGSDSDDAGSSGEDVLINEDVGPDGDGSLIDDGAGPGVPAPGTTAGGPNGTNCNPQVVGLLRDFTDAHPNFEGQVSSEKGIVAATLGADQKPVFAGGNGQTVTTAADFDQWYRDVMGVNESFQHTLTFTQSASGTAVYDNSSFFPLDDRGFGNQGRNHNFHFTFELHMRFRYEGGESFSFTGDDDLFVFINNRLAIDLGGVHAAESDTVNLDESAAELGIVVGQEYPIDFFQAERHTSESNFRIETSLLFTNCDPIIIPGEAR